MGDRFEPKTGTDWRSQRDAHNNWTRRIKTQLEAGKLVIPTIHQDHDELWKYNKSNKQVKQENTLGILIVLVSVASMYIGYLITQ